MFGKFNVRMFNPPYDPATHYLYIYDPTDENYILAQPKLTLEYGKSGSFEFVVPNTHPYYNEFRQLVTVVIVEMWVNENQYIEIFRGRVLNSKVDFRGSKKIFCEGCMGYLVDSVQRGFKFKGKVVDFLKKVINAHNAMFADTDQHKQITFCKSGDPQSYYIDDSLANREIIIPGKQDAEQYATTKFNYRQIVLDSLADKWSTSLDLIEDCLIDNIGGYMNVYSDNTGELRLSYKEGEISQDPSQVMQHIEFGENLIDWNAEIPSDDIFTVLIPLGDQENDKKGPITLNESDRTITFEGHRLQLKGKEIRDLDAIARFGRIVRTESFSSVTNKATLLEDGERFIVNNVEYNPNYEVKAVDMNFIDDSYYPIRIGDTVNLLSLPHGINENVICTKIEYNFEKPGNSTFTFGNPKQDLAARYRQNKKRSSGSSSGSASGSGGKKKTGSGKTVSDTTPSSKEVADSVEEANIESQSYTDQSLEKFYDDYIHFNNEGDLTIGDALGKIGTFLGFDFDHDTGTIDLHSITRLADDVTELSGRVYAYSNADEAGAALEATYTGANNVKHEAFLKVIATAAGSTIQGRADAIDIQTSKLTQLTNSAMHALTTTGILSSDDGNGLVLFSQTDLNDAVNAGKTMESLKAQVHVFSDATQAYAALEASYSAVGGIKHEAYLKVLATAAGTTIEGQADAIDIKTNEYLDEIANAITQSGLATSDRGRRIALWSQTKVNEGFSTLRSEVASWSNAHEAGSALEATYNDNNNVKHEGYLKVIATAAGSTIRGRADAIDIQTNAIATKLDNTLTAFTNVGILSSDDGHGMVNFSRTQIFNAFNGTEVAELAAQTHTFSDATQAYAALEASYSERGSVVHEGYLKVIATAAGTTIEGRANAIDIQTTAMKTRVDSAMNALTTTGILSSDDGQGIVQFSKTELVDAIDSGKKFATLEAQTHTWSNAQEAGAALEANYNDNNNVKHEGYLKVVATAAGTTIKGEADNIRLGLKNKWGIDINSDRGITIGDKSTFIDVIDNLITFNSDYVNFTDRQGKNVLSMVSDDHGTLVTVYGDFYALKATFDKLVSKQSVSVDLYAGTIRASSIIMSIDDNSTTNGIYYGAQQDIYRLLPKTEIVQLIENYNYLTSNDISNMAVTGGDLGDRKNGVLSSGNMYALRLDVGSNGAHFHSGNGAEYNFAIDGGNKNSPSNGTLSAGNMYSTNLYVTTANIDTLNATTISNLSEKVTSAGFWKWDRDQIDKRIKALVKPSALIGG